MASSKTPEVEEIERLLGNPPDLVVRPLHPGQGRPAAWVLFLSTIADRRMVSAAVLRPLARGRWIEVPQVQAAREIGEAVDKLLDGWTTVVAADRRVWLCDTSRREARAVEEPANETGVRLPREGFTETLETGLALVRTRLRHQPLRLEMRRVGRRTRTRVVLAYIEGLIDPEILRTVRSRLDRVELDGVLESGYIEEFLEETPWSPFPQTLRTERPDVVVANLLEGRFAVFVDGTPFVLVGPVVLWQLLHASEDYYERFSIASLLRILRYAAFLISLLLPGLYVALTTYHQEMIPTPLLQSIAAAREGVPFPALVEALIMELNFEMLREAGLRLPRAVGSAISIVGALVLGQAAISANLVSPAMVIIVAITAIASFSTPVFSMAIAARIVRFSFTLAGATLGLFGIQTVAVLLAIHLCALRSFGIPYLAPVAPARVSDWRDLVLRVPWWAMRRRPSFPLPQRVLRMRGGRAQSRP